MSATTGAAWQAARDLLLADIDDSIRKGSAVPLFKGEAWQEHLRILREGGEDLDSIGDLSGLIAQRGTRFGIASIRRGPPRARLTA